MYLVESEEVTKAEEEINFGVEKTCELHPLVRYVLALQSLILAEQAETVIPYNKTIYVARKRLSSRASPPSVQVVV